MFSGEVWYTECGGVFVEAVADEGFRVCETLAAIA
jgi:hypothetical protein